MLFDQSFDQQFIFKARSLGDSLHEITGVRASLARAVAMNAFGIRDYSPGYRS
jgi:hypothetical protein